MSTVGASASGMVYGQTVMDVVANNIANVNTPSFKRSRIVPATAPAGQEGAGGGRMGVAEASTERVFLNGAMLEAGDQLHFAVADDAFFRAVDFDGTPVMTRLGALSVDAARNVTLPRGRFLEPPVTLPEGSLSPELDAGGAVSAIDDQGVRQVYGQISMVRVLNPAGLESLGDGLYRETVNTGPLTEGVPGDGNFSLLVLGAIEGSNVDLAEEMTQMVLAQRAYQISAKTFAIGDEMLQLATNITR